MGAAANSRNHFKWNIHALQKLLKQFLFFMCFWKNLKRRNWLNWHFLFCLYSAGTNRLLQSQQPFAKAVTVFSSERSQEISVKMFFINFPFQLPMLFQPGL